MGTDELEAIRRRIDAVDVRLVEVLAERSRLIGEIIAYKSSHHLAVVDRRREKAMLRRIARLAKAEGLDPRIAQQVLRAVIDAFTLLEVEHLSDAEPDAASSSSRRRSPEPGRGSGSCE